MDGKLPHVGIDDTRNNSACVWKLLEVLKCLSDFGCKSFGDCGVPLAVPIRRLP
jgi:hypothetical protein